MRKLFKMSLLAITLSFCYIGTSFAGTVWSVTVGNYPRHRPVVKTVIYASPANYVVINNCVPRKVRHFKKRRVIYRPAVVITPAGYIDYNVHITGTGFYPW